MGSTIDISLRVVHSRLIKINRRLPGLCKHSPTAFTALGYK